MNNPMIQPPRLERWEQAFKACPRCHRVGHDWTHCEFCGAPMSKPKPTCSHHGEQLVDGRCPMCDLERKYEAPEDDDDIPDWVWDVDGSGLTGFNGGQSNRAY